MCDKEAAARHSPKRLRWGLQVWKLRFGLPHEDSHNPTRKRVDVNIDISSLTRRVMKQAQLQSLQVTSIALSLCSRRLQRESGLEGVATQYRRLAWETSPGCGRGSIHSGYERSLVFKCERFGSEEARCS